MAHVYTSSKKAAARRSRRADNGNELTWEIARFFPAQGQWTEDEYLSLEDHYGAHIRVELSEGRLEVLPMPTEPHQLILAFLWKYLERFVELHAPGVVLFSGTRVRLRLRTEVKFREPDVVYMSAKHASRRHKEFWDGADLVMEVVSGDAKDRIRDWKTKPVEYAAAGIPEYWIVDPEKKVIRVLTLKGRSYRRHGDFKPGSRATSVLLPGFAVAVDEVLAAGSA
ncbi:MAG: Uma2 family endonuclease [Gemmataceae bacterium]|nr:Uma2 family endonuclease [Gemmataceae bacterium]